MSLDTTLKNGVKQMRAGEVRNKDGSSALIPDFVWWSYDCYNHLSELPVESGGGMGSINQIMARVRRALETSEEFKNEYPPYTQIVIKRYSSRNHPNA